MSNSRQIAKGLLGWTAIIALAVFFFVNRNPNDTPLHFIKSMEHAITATKVKNNGHAFSEVSDADIQEILKYYKLALKEAAQVDTDELDRKYSNFGSMYKETFVKGTTLFVEALEKRDGAKAVEAQMLIDKWGDWYMQNLEKMRKI